MESKSIVVGLVIGVMIGSFLGYMAAPMPSSIPTRHSQITSPPEYWTLIKTWKGSSDRNTETFNVLSNQIRITWSLDVGENTHFAIILRDDKGEWVEAWTHLDDQPEGHTYAHITPGKYYLEISDIRCKYTVKVEVLS